MTAADPHVLPATGLAQEGRTSTPPCHPDAACLLPQLRMLRSEIGVLLPQDNQLPHPTVALHRQLGQGVRVCLHAARHVERRTDSLLSHRNARMRSDRLREHTLSRVFVSNRRRALCLKVRTRCREAGRVGSKIDSTGTGVALWGWAESKRNAGWGLGGWLGLRRRGW